MALPDSRNTTYVAGVSQVKSTDLNDIQDKIISARHEARWKQISAFAGYLHTDTPTAYRFSNGFRSLNTGGGKILHLPIDLHVGDRILTLVVDGRAGGAVGEALDAALVSVDAAGTAIDEWALKYSATSDGPTTITFNTSDAELAPSGFVLAAGKIYYLLISLPETSANGEAAIHGVRIHYDR